MTATRIRETRPATASIWERLWRNRKNLAVHFVQSLPSTTAAVEQVVERTMQVVEEMGCGRGHEEAIDISLREALTNAIVHGNRENPRKRVTVCLMCHPKRGLLLIVRDRGAGFNPRRLTSPLTIRNIFSSHGRGIFLIRRFMDEVKFARGGREIRMHKRPAARRRRALS